MIRLEIVNDKTFRKVLRMKLPPEQDVFVAPNVVSMAQAWLYSDVARPYAILNEADEVVGFVMLDCDSGERTVGFWRFMVAPEHQRKGYGRQAIEAVIEMTRSEGVYDMIYLDYVQGNEVARNLYYSFGFRENGEIEDDEIIMTLPLTDTPKVGVLKADSDDTDDIIEIIEEETKKGTAIPTLFSDTEKLKEAIERKDIWRYTVMGETIGISCGDAFLLSGEYQKYYDEAQGIFETKRD